VNLTAQLPGLTWTKVIDARVAMEANVHPFKQLVRAVASGSQKPAVIGRETANQAVDWMIAANRTGIGIARIDVGWQIYLSTEVHRVCRAAQLVQHRHSALGKNETARDIIALFTSRKPGDPDTSRFEPLKVDRLMSFIG